MSKTTKQISHQKSVSVPSALWRSQGLAAVEAGIVRSRPLHSHPAYEDDGRGMYHSREADPYDVSGQNGSSFETVAFVMAAHGGFAFEQDGKPLSMLEAACFGLCVELLEGCGHAVEA